LSRRRISTTERLAIFKRHRGICHLCHGKIAIAELWDLSHGIPLELGGEDGGDNLQPAHRSCHRDQTAKVDLPTIARAKRREARHRGARPAPKRPIRSAGFPASAKRKANPTPELPRRRLFVEVEGR